MTDRQDDVLMKKLSDAARTGTISRRSFLYHAMAAGLTATTATGVWTRSARAEPKRGGTFRVASHDGSTSDSHDPGAYLNFSVYLLANAHRSYITAIESDSSLGPDIAKEWSATPDAKEWSFQLDRRAVFHSGKKVVADDVIASLNHHRGEKSTSAAKSLLAGVKDVVKNDDYSITIKMESGTADLPWLLTDVHLAICPANSDGTLNWQSGDGSGPYKLVTGEFGRGFELQRHDGWHLQGAHFDAVQIVVINDPNARQTALIANEVDAVTQLELKTLALLGQDPSIKVLNLPSGTAITMPMHTNVAPFDNVDVRNAMKLAINRKDMIEKITFGAASPGNDFHHSPEMPYFPKGIPQREYDPDQARTLLKKAGLDRLKVDLSTADSVTSGAVDLAVLFAEHAKAAGIEVNVVREPNDRYWSDVWLKKPFCIAQWGARPTPDLMYSTAYKDDAAWNESKWNNPRFNELLLKARAELNDSLRAEMYREMAMISRDDGGTILPMFLNLVFASRSNVMQPEKIATNWALDGARGTSRWWFE
ncbi:ABC transporter substrate-binding protein [Mesorhizobium sp. B2-4-15]|uniref:ABC transporter substrate-binding protein n=1 Tax=Mesorhizobium sp. B2-4-15 TaxID=2589934 RepID=UPI001150B523|nr:ABC transporter substrate-binding protein [Mesorhizobium sp. B2-4-15]TPK73598.1 ABC transporter substrate-binding protein [Mesorhizobium sp. B2-4-15]